jgi:hypothetical protein
VFRGTLRARSSDGTMRDEGIVSLSVPETSEIPQGVFTVTRGGTTESYPVERLRWTRATWLPWSAPPRSP